MLLIMFYHSNLRHMIIAPSVDPEINSDEDIFKYDIKTIHTDLPHEHLPIFYTGLKHKQPMMYDKVKSSYETAADVGNFNFLILH